MRKTTGFYPRLAVDAKGGSAVGQAGGVLLTSTVRVAGLDAGLSAALAPWRPGGATHDPAKVLLDLAITLALGGDTCSDLAVVRAEPAVFGSVASDPTLSRTITRLAGDVDKVLAAIDRARASARARVWAAAGTGAPDHGVDARHPLVVDVDATLVTSHSQKENAKPTFKKGFGFHPLCAFVDHGATGTGEPLAIMLRPGNAGSTPPSRSAGGRCPHRGVASAARGPGRQVGAGAHRRGRIHPQGHRLAHAAPVGLLGRVHPVRKERPHPGAQLRFEDVEGMRITAFATNTVRGQLPDLELRHRRRARCEDRIRIAKDTGLTNLPLASFAANQIWCAVVAPAAEITAWMQLLAFADSEARRWEPKKLRYRIFTIAATLARSGRRTWPHLSARSPWSDLTLTGLSRLVDLAPG